MTAAYPIRAIGADEFPAFYAVIEHAFNSSHQTDAEMQHDLATFEFDRSLAAFDGADMVGTAGAFTFQMGVPGGIAPVAGVTAVAGLPSPPRRGVPARPMRRPLAGRRQPAQRV